MSKEQKITGNIQPPNKDLEILKQNFPSCFDKNGEFDFEKFKIQLSKNEINFSKESYGMDWLGKSYARLLATDETTTLLQEDEKFNQKEGNSTSENLLIKGDNLEVLKHLSNAYYEKVKMIYIDPPYNTGSDGFVYADDRKFTVEELQELAGVNEERAKRILDFTQSKSNSHSAWLTFMYPRLYIAKQLLKDDGAIFVSIDDNELAQLKLLLDEIFGEENFVEIFTWNKTSTPASLSKKSRKTVEYILCYEKNKNNFKYYGEDLSGGDQPLLNEGNNIGVLKIPKDKIIFKIDDGIYNSGQYHRINLLNDIEIIEGKSSEDLNIEGRFKWQQSFLDNEISKGTTFIIKSNKFSIRFQRFEDESYKTPTNYIRDNIIFPLLDKTNAEIDTNETSSKELEELFGCKVFDFPKPVSLIKYLINFLVNENELILDFFAGSGTTGDSVMQLNAEDAGNRKFILAQLPELIDQESNKTAYDFVKNELKVEIPTIFEITKERLIRASKKIQEEREGEDLSNQDLGFKIFETTPIWEDYNFESEELEKQTSLFDESKLTQEDIKALLVTWKTYDGVPLTKTIQETNLNAYIAHYSNEKLYLMDKGFTTENLKTLLEKIDSDKSFNPTTIIAFGYHFESKSLREISENIKSYANKKSIDIDFITRY
ncbi:MULTISPECIES: site-specific DNA-methyltransferase [Croceibacter]|uniref:site-specific DNA-methyltransferase n=1 Tax=Croceibacter TaxID=216431 RepID=UPI000C556196|nr:MULTISPECIES: site-specific DNA-methyltransferase [Croceibacter]MBG25678.1 site-specific DNA-methyltransferase [Croceibacter sp.]|tara:strand:+ start:982 stop:2952 length:1971 start_codon:yes stop_codon:yes gene_type:complete